MGVCFRREGESDDIWKVLCELLAEVGSAGWSGMIERRMEMYIFADESLWGDE